MQVSHKHKFLFIHIPKTAGISIASTLDPYSDHPRDKLLNRLLSKIDINVNWVGPTLALKYGRGHSTARQMKIMFPRSVFEQYYKFAFVRNPWDLMVSYYHYLQSRPKHHRNRKVQDMGFKEYLQYEIKRNKINQSKFVTDSKGNLIVDYIGHFETLQDDFGKICTHIGIDAKLGHRNKSDHKDYRDYYDEETKQMVAEHWKEDIERFGYTFDGILAK